MRKYKMAGGWEIEATNEQELTHLLNEQSLFGYREDVQQFMEGTSRACKLYNGTEIRFDSFENFVEDLIFYGFLMEVNNAQA